MGVWTSDVCVWGGYLHVLSTQVFRRSSFKHFLFIFIFLSVKFSGFSTVTKWCRLYYYLIENILLLQKETRPLSSHWPTSPPCPSTPQATTNPLSVFIDWPVLDMWYKWNHILRGLYAFGFCHLAWWSEVPSCTVCRYFIPFCVWIKCHCLGILHFIYPFISWWTLGGFLFLALINNAAMNVHVHAFVCTRVFDFFWLHP